MKAVTPPAVDAERLRADFPILLQKTRSGLPLAYLDNGASTQHPEAVIEAMSQCYRDYYSNVHRGIHTFSEAATAHYEAARQRVADFLHSASTRQILFTSGTTAAINLVARSWGDAHLGPGDVILLTIMEHHANIVPWHQLAQRTGCRVEFVPLTDQGEIDPEVFADHVARLRPRLVALTAISNLLGTINPVAPLTQIAHQADACVLIDAAQAAPHQPIDVQQWDADFVAFSGHKVCGPTGIGVLYGREEILEAMPPFLGGGAMIQRVTVEGFEPAGLPEKFEAGTPPIVEAIGLDAALRYVGQIGMESIQAYEQQLIQRAWDGLSSIDGVRLLGPPPEHRAGLVGFVVRGVHAHDVAQWLDTRGIAVRAGHHCAMPLHTALGISASTRASFYFYNTVEEVDRLVEAVAEVGKKFAPSGRRRRPRGPGC